jgi:putative transcriptional regulator
LVVPTPDPVLPAPAAGTLLVAGPSLEDPNFRRTVVLLLAFGAAEGALGVVLNRPNDVPVGEILPGWGDLTAPPDSMFVGGPVARDNVICLGRLRRPGGGEDDVDGCSPVPGLPGLATVDLNRSPADMIEAVDTVRIFSGYAGWSPGQLEGELGVGGWLVLPAQLGDAFTPAPSDLWRAVLLRSGGRVALYANAPPKLSMN